MALLWRQDAGERAGLPQLNCTIAGGAEQREQLRQRGHVQELPPLGQVAPRGTAEPAFQVRARHVEKPRISFQPRRDGFVEGQTALLNPLVRPHD